MELLDIYSGSNNGRIALSARGLAERLPVSRATAARALLELTDRGFIEITRPGGFSLKSGARRASEWRLTQFRCDLTGELPAKKFMQWQDGKFHFTASPESQNGLATGPLNANAK